MQETSPLAHTDFLYQSHEEMHALQKSALSQPDRSLLPRPSVLSGGFQPPRNSRQWTFRPLKTYRSCLSQGRI